MFLSHLCSNPSLGDAYMFSSQPPPLCRKFPVLQRQSQASAWFLTAAAHFHQTAPFRPPGRPSQEGTPCPRWVDIVKTLWKLKCFTAVGWVKPSPLSSCPSKGRESLAPPLCPQHVGPWVLLCPPTQSPILIPSSQPLHHLLCLSCPGFWPVPTFTPPTLHCFLHRWSLLRAKSPYPIRAGPFLLL